MEVFVIMGPHFKVNRYQFCCERGGSKLCDYVYLQLQVCAFCFILKFINFLFGGIWELGARSLKIDLVRTCSAERFRDATQSLCGVTDYNKFFFPFKSNGQ